MSTGVVFLLCLLVHLGTSSNLTGYLLPVFGEYQEPQEPFRVGFGHPKVVIETFSPDSSIHFKTGNICFEIVNGPGRLVSSYKVCWKEFYSAFVDLVDTVVTLKERVKKLERQRRRSK